MKKRPAFFPAGLAVCALAAVSAGCRSPEAELAGYFGRDTFWEGRGTPRQYMTDRVVDAETARLVRDLSSSEKKRRTAAFEELSRLRDLVEFGRKWSLPALEIRPAEAKKPPAIDGRIGKDEWKDTVEISGSCRAGRMRRNFDASRLLFKYDGEFLYLAFGFPLAADASGKRRATDDDHALVYFDTPGGERPVCRVHLFSGQGRSGRRHPLDLLRQRQPRAACASARQRKDPFRPRHDALRMLP